MKATNIIWDLDDGMEDEEEINDYLSETTGYCHKGFALC